MKYKLTMISISSGNKRLTRFVMLPVEADGRAHAPMSVINPMLDALGCRNGQTFSVG
jgi:hypothetical protein